MATVSLEAYAPGDPEAGIASQRWSINDVGDLDDYPGQRDDVRAAFKHAFLSLIGDGERIVVAFSDEFE
jgi:hypothetical protein